MVHEVQQVEAGSGTPRLVYVHDPMCSWCWAFRPVFERLCARLPDTIAIRCLLGGLAPDDERPMPPAMQAYLQQTWRQIQVRVPGTVFNFDFWSSCIPRRSTWPACRAVIATRALAPGTEDAMVSAIQHAYYLEARNPSDTQTLVDLAGSLGMDARRFCDAVDAQQTQSQLEREIAQARAMGVTGFPSLRLETAGRVRPIEVDYVDAAPMLAAIQRSTVN